MSAAFPNDLDHLLDRIAEYLVQAQVLWARRHRRQRRSSGRWIASMRS
jgi:hypothetical protein